MSSLHVPESWSRPLTEGELCPANAEPELSDSPSASKTRRKQKGKYIPGWSRAASWLRLETRWEACVVVPCFIPYWVWKPAKNHKGGYPAADEFSVAVILDIIEQ